MSQIRSAMHRLLPNRAIASGRDAGDSMGIAHKITDMIRMWNQKTHAISLTAPTRMRRGVAIDIQCGLARKKKITHGNRLKKIPNK
jgi:hypothetical protein